MSLADKIAASTEKKRAKVARARTRIDVDLIERAKKLGSLLKSHHLEAAVKVWIAGLSATKEIYDKASETWSTVPDWKERRENANMIVAYMEGRPIERQMVLSGNFEDFGSMLESLRSSPEAIKALQSITGSPELLAESAVVHETPPEKDVEPTREETP